LTPDGKTLFAASGRFIFRWDTATWHEQLPRLEEEADVTAFALHPDGRRLVASTAGSANLDCWTLPLLSSQGRPPEPLRVMAYFAQRMHALAFSLDGAELAGIDKDNKIVLWNGATLALKYRFNDGAPGWTEAAYLAPGILVTCHGDGSLRSFDMRANHVRDWKARDWEVTAPTPVEALAFSPDGKTLAASSHAWYEKVDFFRNGNRNSRGEHTTVGHGPVAPPGTLWDVASGQPGLALTRQDLYASRALAFHPSGGELAVGSGSPAVWRYDPANGKHLSPFLVDTRANAHWGLLDIARLMGLTPHTEFRDTPVLVAYSPDGKLLAAATDEEHANVKVWELESGQQVFASPKQDGPAMALAFAPDSSTLAISIGNRVQLWDVARREWRLSMGPGPVHCLAFAPDGSLAGGTDGGVGIIWDPSTGAAKRFLPGHAGRISGVAFSPDGKTVATASLDRKVILWRAASGQRLLDLEGHTGPVHCLAFSPDGTILATGGQAATGRGELFLWDAPPVR
jgi:WD40 repeat protein